jgi:hypothetical protein
VRAVPVGKDFGIIDLYAEVLAGDHSDYPAAW